MPLFLTLKNGQRLLIAGDKPRGLKVKKGWVQATGMNGHSIGIVESEICAVEHVPLDEYNQQMDEVKKTKEAAATQGAGRIARPAMAIPGRRN